MTELVNIPRHSPHSNSSTNCEGKHSEEIFSLLNNQKNVILLINRPKTLQQ